MALTGLWQKLEQCGENEFMVWDDQSYSYRWLRERARQYSAQLPALGISPGTVVHLDADFSPESVAALLALIDNRCIVAPTTGMPEVKQAEFRAIAEADVSLQFEKQGWRSVEHHRTQTQHHPLLQTLVDRQHPGLVLFSSGSTGQSKAAVHDMTLLIEKFAQPRKTMRIIAFLLFDHIGGINTLFYTLFNGGCLVVPADRTPPKVARAIEQHKVTALTTTPTFLNLLLLGDVCQRYDLSSLRVINYGSEVMLESTLRRLVQAFPLVRLSQGYGLSEVGVVPTVSKSSNSVLIQLKNEDGFQTRIVNGMLEIKSKSAMLGYLNAPAPFTADGWFRTGDAVEVHDGYLRILGRASEMINVGGQKVYPTEVENVLQEMDGVTEVAVSGETNPITGHIVRAVVRLGKTESLAEFRSRMRRFCQSRLPPYMIPQRIVLTDESVYGPRFKKMRNQEICI